MILAGNDYEFWAAMLCHAAYVGREQGHRIGPLGLWLYRLGQRVCAFLRMNRRYHWPCAFETGKMCPLFSLLVVQMLCRLIERCVKGGHVR